MPQVSATVGVLADDSSNIVSLVEEEYHRIAQKIALTDDSLPEIKVTYRTRCKGGAEQALNATNVCDNVRVGDEVDFEVTVEAIKCTPKTRHTINIRPSGIDEVLQINVRLLCACDCAEGVERGSAACSGEGDLVCGVCECTGTAVGRNCECSAPGFSTAELDDKCRRSGEAELCSGRGRCDCGTCGCVGGASGPYCECDNANCPRHNRQVCGGHGECACSKCICAQGYTGRACECPEAQDTCRASNGLLCNGKGSCVCGQCVCNTDDEGIRYSGPTCEVCPTCPTQCEALADCVLCQGFQSGSLNESACAECPFQGVLVPALPDDEDAERCEFTDPGDYCTYYFSHVPGPGAQRVWIRREKECPEPLPWLPIVAGVAAGVVLIGLLILILWRICTSIMDKREVQEFEKERKNVQWPTGQNPLYKDPLTTHQNPAFQQRQQRMREEQQYEQKLN